MNGFIRGLVLPRCLESEHLVAASSFFLQVVNHVRAIERACIQTYRGGSKRPCYQYNAMVFHPRIGIYLIEINFTYSLSNPHMQLLRLYTTLGLVVVVTVGRFLFGLYGVFNMDL